MGFSQRLHDIRTGFERPFWVANVTELFERLSYYAAFASLARYLNESLKFPVEQASEVAMRALKEFVTEHPEELDLIEMTTFSAGDFRVYERAYGKVFGES